MENPYLKIIQSNNIIPNFWCSELYFSLSSWKYHREGKRHSIRDEEGFLMFPSLTAGGDTIREGEWWSSFLSQLPPVNCLNPFKFLDYNFIYDPISFSDLRGKLWKTFRKNSNKFKGKELHYQFEDDSSFAKNAFLYWLENRPEDEEIHDGDTILKYMDTRNKKILFDEHEVYGVNVWDSNYKFVNYRYCFTKDIPFISEYLRLLFYTDPLILRENKLVNDGGCLNSESLFFFKNRLNPLTIHNVYTKQ